MSLFSYLMRKSPMSNDDQAPHYRNEDFMRQRPVFARRSPQPVRELLRSVLRRNGLEKAVTRYEFVIHWNEIMGPDLARRTAPELIRNNILSIRVHSSAWAQELSFHKAVILKRLNHFYGGDEPIRDIFFVVDKQRR
jgi:predicted nucleic acid-binding Zn ribbon protein